MTDDLIGMFRAGAADAEVKDKRIAELEDDYNRRHKDAVDRLEENIALKARIAALEAENAELQRQLDNLNAFLDADPAQEAPF